jgi:hypothetical protein
MPSRPKSKPQKKASTSTDPSSQRTRLVEEFARLDQEIENFKPRIFRHQKLRQLILDWYPDALSEDEITVSGINCDILISARDKIRTVSPVGKEKLYKLWGARGFVARAIVLLKSLPDPKDERGLYTMQAMTGPRHLRVVARVSTSAVSAA